MAESSSVLCEHPSDQVVADICQGDILGKDGQVDTSVQWCRICGAYRINRTPHTAPCTSEWHVPDREKRLAGVLPNYKRLYESTKEAFGQADRDRCKRAALIDQFKRAADTPKEQ